MPTVVWVTTSPRVAPGLLSAPAWAALRAHPVYAAGEHRQAAALRAEGIPVTPGDPQAGDCAWLAAEDGTGDAAFRATLDADPEVTVLDIVGSYDVPGARLLDAVAVMDRLRSPGGCPWDAEQTHASLAPYLLEETYEAYQAIEDGAIDVDLREELGDVLLQVLFHARLAEERAEPWSVDDVADGLVRKLVGRHPHVFGDVSAADAAEVERNWDAIKRAEKGRASAVDGVALSQPSLSLTAKLLSRARKAGLPDALPDVEAGAGPDELVGRALFGLVARATIQKIDPEAALRTVARAYEQAVRAEEGQQ